MQKKTLIVFAFLISIIVLLMPLEAGVLFKKHYLALINTINKENRIKIELLNYKQGWFHSYAKLNVSFIDKALTSIPSFTIDEEISHGPIIYDNIRHVVRLGYANIESDIYFSNQPQQIVYNDLPHTSVIELETIAQLDGDWFVNINIPTLYLSMPLIGKLYIEKLNGELKIFVHNDRIRHVKMTAETGSISMQSDQSIYIKKIDIQPIQYTYDAAHEKEGLWSGNAILSSPTIVLTRADGSTIILDKFSTTNTFTVGGDTFYNTNLSISIEAAKIAIAPLIPTISSVQVLVSADNFDMQFINDYIHLFKSNSSTEIMKVDYEKISSLLAHTITKVSVFSIHATAKTPIGDIALHLRTIWNALAPLPTSIADIGKYSSTKIDIRASASFVDKLIEAYGPMLTIVTATAPTTVAKPNSKDPVLDPAATTKLIANLILLGYFHKDMNDYITSVTIENGICKINRTLVCPNQFKLPVPISKPK